MFVVLLTYIKPLEQVEKLLAEHIAFLDCHYASGCFIASGRRVPRSGGVILARGENPEQLQAILVQDPFYCEGVARYDLYPFVPSKMQPGFEQFI